MERCTTCLYQGKEIQMFDYSGLRDAELLNTVQAATQIMLNGAPGELLVLADFRKTYINDEVIGYLTGAESRAASKNARKIAVLGVTGLKKLFFNAYNAATFATAKAFDTLDEAKAYLVA